jgi:predicted DNA-binding protein
MYVHKANTYVQRRFRKEEVMEGRKKRLTDDPKTMRLELRLGEDHKAMLDYCSEVLGLPRAEIVRQGIEVMYQKALEQKEK